jgi:hypothetical protein
MLRQVSANFGPDVDVRGYAINVDTGAPARDRQNAGIFDPFVPLLLS